MDLSNRAVLRTARLELRPLRQEDAPAVIDGVGRLSVSRYLSVVPHPYGPQDFAAFLPNAMPGRFWAIDDGPGLIGVISLAPGLGFWVAPDRQGRGYVTEAARAVLAAHFADPSAGPVTSGYFEDNRASARVHRKLGFRTTAVAQAFCQAFEQARPVKRQRLTRQGWAASLPPSP
ncbi:GNAT family N-acetyltransferase [Neotabrizicola sp. sgz301269]|uniref:GNAT family N-acetyltransferase n=1 Tax=Neotabrizicola sp. sgz301269 TaxID=3276282 RepID=UPI00376FB69A